MKPSAHPLPVKKSAPRNSRLTVSWLIPFGVLIIFLVSCERNTEPKQVVPADRKHTFSESSRPFCYEGITELKRGDIIVKPNMNLFPGTTRVPGGYFFGHAALVVRGAQHDNPDSLLAHARIIESTAADVPRAFQIREVPGYYASPQPHLNSTRFDPVFKGRRYRLRLNLTESQIDSIIEFALAQKSDLSAWNAVKSYPGNPRLESQVKSGVRKNRADNSTWYCSLLVWQSVLFVTGIDLDPNGGFEVYPNDLINSPLFNNGPDGVQRRVRF